MKILIGMPSEDSWGGPIASEPPFVEAFKRLGHDVTTEVYVYGDKEKPTPFFSRVTRVLRTALRFRKLISRNAFDIIHLNTAFDMRTLLRDSVSIFLMKPGKAKVFLKLHGSAAEEFEHASALTRLLISFLRRRVDGFGYFTTDELESFLRLGFDPRKFFRVRNPITIQDLLPTDFNRDQKAPGDTFELIFLSRFIKTKGLIETIRACSILRSRGFKFRLTCVGDGEIRREADDAVGRLGLGRVTRFTGYVPEDEVARLLISSDVFVFPTTHIEGFPIALFKAIAVGLPVVTTRIRAAADYLSEPENCLFCTNDPSNIADRLERLLGDLSGRRSMSSANFQLGRSFSPEIIANEFSDVYTKVLDLTPSNR